MEAGLASTVMNTYGSGEGNTVQHFYAGSKNKKKKKKESKVACKSKKKKGK